MLKRLLLSLPIALAAIAAQVCVAQNTNQASEPFWLGADISGTTQMEDAGVVFYNNKGEVRENTALMHELGLNAIRLRVWVNPRGGYCSPQDVLSMAKRAKYYGMAVMIDFHYSDWWADPGKQPMPAVWQYFNMWEMKEAVAAHTTETLRLLKDAGVDVRWVQVGNETTHGFLWPMARAEENMKNYAELTQCGYDAVKSVYPDAQVIIHLDGGCDPKRYAFIFDGLRDNGAKWDMIGLSVYPYWDVHAKLVKDWKETCRLFAQNIIALNAKYGCETMVVETGAEAAKPDEGKKIMEAVIDAARNKTDGHCKGVFYWAPELEGAYPLGAFQNHRPTAIMEAFTEAAKQK